MASDDGGIGRTVFLLQSGHVLTTWEGIALLLFLVAYLWLLIHRARKSHKLDAKVDEEVDEALSKVSNWRILIWLLLGGLALWGGSELLVKGAVDLAQAMGVSERVIAVTMIAVGTSVPWIGRLDHSRHQKKRPYP